jgi:hypothetical protein
VTRSGEPAGANAIILMEVSAKRGDFRKPKEKPMTAGAENTIMYTQHWR